jgi:hypothetical protein
MKTILLCALVLLTSFNSFSQEVKKNKPKAIYTVGAAQIIVWQNFDKNGKTWKNFEVKKIYKKDDKWLSTHSFTNDELVELKAAIDEAISKEMVKNKE